VTAGMDINSHAALLHRRNGLPADHKMQDVLGPIEHQAWAREYTAEHPVTGTLANLFLVPAYTAAKALGLRSGRSGASMDEMKAGYTGTLQGIGALPKDNQQSSCCCRSTRGTQRTPAGGACERSSAHHYGPCTPSHLPSWLTLRGESQKPRVMSCSAVVAFTEAHLHGNHPK
jgi:hypothetical protein